MGQKKTQNIQTRRKKNINGLNFLNSAYAGRQTWFQSCIGTVFSHYPQFLSFGMAMYNMYHNMFKVYNFLNLQGLTNKRLHGFFGLLNSIETEILWRILMLDYMHFTS